MSNTPGIDKAAADYLAANPLLSDPGEPSAVFSHAVVDAYGHVVLDAEALRRKDPAAISAALSSLGLPGMSQISVVNNLSTPITVNGAIIQAMDFGSSGPSLPSSVTYSGVTGYLSSVSYGSNQVNFSGTNRLKIVSGVFAIPIVVPANADIGIVIDPLS